MGGSARDTVCFSGSGSNLFSRELEMMSMLGLVDWGLGRSEPPSPASPTLPARMDALTQLLALCSCKIHPGMKTRAGAALTEAQELLGFVFHTGLEQGQPRKLEAEPVFPSLFPSRYGTKSPRASRVVLTCPKLVWVAATYFNSDFSFSRFVSLPFIWETGQEPSLIFFFFSMVFVTANLAPAAT